MSFLKHISVILDAIIRSEGWIGQFQSLISPRLRRSRTVKKCKLATVTLTHMASYTSVAIAGQLLGALNVKILGLVAIAAAASLALGSAAQAANLVVNGDFTQLSNGVGQFDTNTTVTGWSGGGGYNFVMSVADVGGTGTFGNLSLWDAANGGTSTWNGLAAGSGNFAALDGDFETSAISQTINGLTVGKTYLLGFDYAFGQQTGFSGDTLQKLTASFGGLSATSSTFTVPSHGFTGWQFVSGLVTATSSSETLSFLANGNLPVPPFALVSNVSLTAVPEPSTWALTILGFAGLGAALRVRRRQRLALAEA